MAQGSRNLTDFISFLLEGLFGIRPCWEGWYCVACAEIKVNHLHEAPR